MISRILLLIAALSLLVALATSPGNAAVGEFWSRGVERATTNDGCDHYTGSKVCTLRSVAATASAGDTPPLFIGGRVCYVFFDDDIALATHVGATATLFGCWRKPVAADTWNQICEEIYDDAGAVTFDGNGATGRAKMYGLQAQWIGFTVVNAADKGYVIQVECVFP